MSAGRICLVTGATEGIGKVTAMTLAKQGATVAIICRNPDKAKELAAVGVDVFVADLSLLAEVRRVAAEIAAKYDHLDVLVNNAGAIFINRVVTSEGLEKTFALNHLAYFLLTDLLRPLLEKSRSARIINVASRAHTRGKIDFDDLQATRSYAGFSQYGASKLANIMFTYELARRLPKHVTANALHPGVIATGFGRGEATSWLKPLISIARPFFITPEQGAVTQLYLATSPEVEGITGRYWDKSKQIQPNKRALDEAAQKRLWQMSAELVTPRGR
jgi:NAD(P)-dependent dehydrogenase (short-subunit alcohol dehydrogenase family)